MMNSDNTKSHKRVLLSLSPKANKALRRLSIECLENRCLLVRIPSSAFVDLVRAPMDNEGLLSYDRPETLTLNSREGAERYGYTTVRHPAPIPTPGPSPFPGGGPPFYAPDVINTDLGYD